MSYFGTLTNPDGVGEAGIKKEDGFEKIRFQLCVRNGKISEIFFHAPDKSLLFTIGEFACAKVNGVDIEKAEETCKNNVLLRFSSKKEAADIALKAFFSAISDYHSRQQKKDSFEDIVDALGKYEEGTPPRNLRHEFEL